MDIKEIHDFIDFIVKKEQGSYFSYEEKDSALERSSISLFNFWRPRYAIDQMAQDALAPFKKPYTFSNASSPDGVVTFPEDYLSLLSIYVQGFDNVRNLPTRTKVKVVNDDDLADRLNSQLRPVTVNKPIAQFIGKGQIQLWPQMANAGVANYLKKPDTPKFGYSLNGRVVEYDEFESTQLEWGEDNLLKVIMGAIEFLGISIDQEKLVAYSMQKRNDN